MYPYDYAASDSNFEVIRAGGTSQWSHYTVTYPAPRPLRYVEGNTVYGDYFIPESAEKMPLAVLVPGFGDDSLVPCLMLARQLVRQKVAALVLYMVFHSRRMPRSMEGQYLPPDAGAWLEAYQVSVTDICRLMDWATGRDEIEAGKISVVGISMGGMIAAIAMAMDRRISRGFFIVTGGNLEELSWGGASEHVSTGHTCTREECRQIYSQYPRYLADVAQKGIENVVPAKECFLFDPLTFAGNLRGRPVMMINAEQDEIIPRQAALEFWEACGKPPLKWLPATHVTIFSHIPFISREVADFLK